MRLNSVSAFYGDSTVKAGGTLEINVGKKLGEGALKIESGATLAVPGPGTVDLSANAVTLESGAALSFHVGAGEAENGAFTFGGGKLSLPESGAVTVKLVEGSKPRIGVKYVLTSGAALEDVKKFKLADGLAGSLSVEDGELVYTAPAMFYLRITENGTVKIPVDWVAENVSAECDDVEQTCANGLAVWQNWCLGLVPKAPESVILCEAAATQPGGGVVSIAAKNVKVLADSGATVTAYLDKSPDAGTWHNIESQGVESGEVSFDVSLPDGETHCFFR